MAGGQAFDFSCLTEVLRVQENKCFGRQEETCDHRDLFRETMADGPQRLHFLPMKPAKFHREGSKKVLPQKI